MKFTVPSKTLHSFASAVSKVINAKNAITILNNFLFSIKGNTLTITACDGENTLCARIPIMDVDGEGDFCIDARRVVELLRVMPEQELNFNVMLRPQMTGVYWDIKPDRLVFVATDTHKLVKFEDQSIQAGVEGSFILPNKSTNVFRSVFSKDEEVTVTLDVERGVTFETDTFTFDSRLVKGRFPDYTRVIPENNPYTLSINRHQFTTAVRRVSLFVDEGHGLIKFRVTPDKLTIKASDNEYNTSGYETLEAEFNGNEMIVGFSSSYLTELASVLWTDDIIFRLADPSRPAVIVPTEDKADTKLTMLLMPMNVQEF